MSTPLRLALPFALVFALGCDTKNDEEGDDHGHHHEAGHESETGHESDCAAETRDDEFMIGLRKTGEQLSVTFVAADPAPPIKGDNTWTVAITDPSDQPLADANITAVTPWMPDHGHGTPIEAVVSAGDNPGEFVITPINLFMSGLWEVTLDVEVGGASEAIVFAFCVE